MPLSVYILLSLLVISAFFYKIKFVVNVIQPVILVLLGIQLAYLALFTDILLYGAQDNINNMPGDWKTVVIIRTRLLGFGAVFTSFWYSRKLYEIYKAKKIILNK